MRPSHRAAAGLSLAFAVFFAPQLFTRGVPYYRDTLVSFIPFRAYIHERLLEGELPQWYPREGLGVPFIGQVNTATFHPQTLLFLWLEPIQAVKWNLLALYAIALFGAYRLARALGHDRAEACVAALAFGFGGYALGVSSNLPYAGAHATFPWVAVFAVRARQSGALRHAVALGAAWALLFLQGDPQAFALAPLVMLAAAACASGASPRRLALCGAAAAAVSAALIAPELLPALSVAAESTRGTGERSATLGLTWALHPLRAAELLVHGFVPDQVRNELTRTLFGRPGALWATTLFFGAAPLLLLALGAADRPRRYLPLLALAVLAFWLSLGDHGGLLPLAIRVAPLLGKFRYPEKYLSLVWVASIPLVAAGAASLLRERRIPLVAVGAAAVSAAAALALARPGVVARLHDGVGVSAGFDQTVASAWRAGLLSAALVLALAAVICWRARPALRGPLLAALVFAELHRGNAAHLPLIPPEALTAPNPLAAAVRPGTRVVRAVEITAPSTVSLGDGEAWAVATRRALRANAAELDRVATLETNSPAGSWRYALLQQSGALARSPELFHACSRVSAHATRPLARDPESGLVLDELACEPRAFVAPAEPVPDAPSAARALQGWPAVKLAVEDGEAVAGAGTARVVLDRPERVEVEASAEGRAVLYLADLHARGWSARDNGAPAVIHPANVAARAVYLEPGPHRVEFEYRAPGLQFGLLLAGLGWAVVVATVVRRLRRRAA